MVELQRDLYYRVDEVDAVFQDVIQVFLQDCVYLVSLHVSVEQEKGLFEVLKEFFVFRLEFGVNQLLQEGLLFWRRAVHLFHFLGQGKQLEEIVELNVVILDVLKAEVVEAQLSAEIVHAVGILIEIEHDGGQDEEDDDEEQGENH